MMSCDGKHSMAFTESGRVFICCYNIFGQLGQNNRDGTNIHSIVLLSNGTIIKKISCGYEHNLLLSQNGDIYWFGNNGCETQITPKKLEINKNKFIDISSHYIYISIAFSMNGIYYVWGKCEKR